MIESTLPLILCKCGAVFEAEYDEGDRSVGMDSCLSGTCPECGAEAANQDLDVVFEKVLYMPECDEGMSNAECDILRKMYVHDKANLYLKGKLIRAKAAYDKWCDERYKEWKASVDALGANDDNRMTALDEHGREWGWWYLDTREFDKAYRAA